MTIAQLQLRNFGPYAGIHSFNFAPAAEGTYNRPLVLVRGKNGVGKSTLMEAARVCLHGNLALGRTVGQGEYRSYVESRIHRPARGAADPDSASVSLTFDHLAFARKRRYEVRRTWARRTAGVAETLTVAEDGQMLADLSEDQKATLLRELIPPCVTDLFLLDNEKLHTLSSDSASSGLLAEMVQSLLGLDLVGRLRRDLDVHLARAGGSGSDHLSEALKSAVRDEEQLAQAAEATKCRLRSVGEEIEALRSAIEEQEHRLAREGHGFSDRLTDLRVRRETLTTDTARQRAVIEEMAAGLMPFAVAPRFCQLVIDRLVREAEAQRGSVARDLVGLASSLIASELADPALWNGLPHVPEDSARQDVAVRIRDLLARKFCPAEAGDTDVLLHASEHDRATLTGWALDSQQVVPHQFCQAVARLQVLERELAGTEESLARIPPHESIAPLVAELNSRHQQMGSLRAREEALREQHRREEYEHLRATWRTRAAREKVKEAGKGRRTVELAAKTQTILEEYSRDLLSQKLRLLERALSERFSQLCRKPAFVTEVSIDREAFALTLYRYGRAFERSSLSAGEKQLLATATLWAMRDVSRLPIPVFIDTPVARLDVDHREAMVEQFLPQVSHQTVLLATDAEADAALAESLQPLLARVYELEYDTTTGATAVRHRDHAAEALPERELDLAL